MFLEENRAVLLPFLQLSLDFESFQPIHSFWYFYFLGFILSSVEYWTRFLGSSDREDQIKVSIFYQSAFRKLWVMSIFICQVCIKSGCPPQFRSKCLKIIELTTVQGPRACQFFEIIWFSLIYSSCCGITLVCFILL